MAEVAELEAEVVEIEEMEGEMAEVAELEAEVAELDAEVVVEAQTAEPEAEVVEIGAEVVEIEEIEAEVVVEAQTAEPEAEVVEIEEIETEVVEIEAETPAETVAEGESGLQLRWPFIRKVYAIITVQLLLTIAVGSVAVSVPHVARFFFSNIPGSFLYIFLIFVPFLRFCPLKYYSILFMFTVTVAFTTGLGCAFLRRKVILEDAILTTAVALSLTISTFWAARRGIDFNFLRPFLSTTLVVTILFAFIQTLLGKSSVMIYGCLTSIIYGGYIIYDTDNIIKRLSYGELIWAAFSLYMDIMDLFGSLSTLFTRNK